MGVATGDPRRGPPELDPSVPSPSPCLPGLTTTPVSEGGMKRGRKGESEKGRGEGGERREREGWESVFCPSMSRGCGNSILTKTVTADSGFLRTLTLEPQTQNPKSPTPRPSTHSPSPSNQTESALHKPRLPRRPSLLNPRCSTLRPSDERTPPQPRENRRK